jgi:uncharacterized protein (TIGR02145 family)
MLKYLSFVMLVFIGCIQDKEMNNPCDEANSSPYYNPDGSFLSYGCIEKKLNQNQSRSKNTQTCVYTKIDLPYSGSGTLRCAEKTYKTQEMNSVVWMAENLNFGEFLKPITDTLFALDDEIRSLKSEWIAQGNEKFCPHNTQESCEQFGGLYQWHTALGLEQKCILNEDCNTLSSTVQGICPVGWHIPSLSEWAQLKKYLDEGVKQKMSAQLKDVLLCDDYPWDEIKDYVWGFYTYQQDSVKLWLKGVRNESHLNLLPVIPSCNKGAFNQKILYWIPANDRYYTGGVFSENALNPLDNSEYASDEFKLKAFPVRCIQDEI